MTEQGVRKLKSVYGICLSVLTAVVGVLFIVQVWSIFLSAEQDPYTPEIVAEKFWQISAPVFLWVAALISGGVIGFIFPDKKEKLKASVSTKLMLSRLKRRVEGGGSVLPEVKKQTLIRCILCCVGLGLCLLACVMSLVILLHEGYDPGFQSEFFTSHGEAGRLLSMMPWVLGALTAAVLVSYLIERSYKKEIGVLKEVVAKERGKKLETAPAQKTLSEKFYEKLPFLRSPKFLLGVRIGLYAVGVAFFIIGIVNGGMADLLTKAINICTQCIGLG